MDPSVFSKGLTGVLYFIIIQAADVVRMMVHMKKEVDEEAKQMDDLGLSDEEMSSIK
ncbi:DUF3387 domain-containing protein [Heyndrickxia sporothermodurans]|uniref:Uncharacterized protein n=1 Tax=Heyndrickxia sporothermodurans TaxID=46224 RepID=A0A150L7G3_9BACI|nr:DUF3387 domain-containing protein [Heyndrickxia sporothermodurans]KYD08261.1 hypothetical protein B4102_2834 [Heyndrickxia sporothermodurans]MBL5768556.1 hypothetical protein [Heyndrickxia sporothermodurans]MBL5772009.1 hypothetical protein [Heyndrickxia sporothermodurans]MBL5775978.1 hypothetical protein [Heyndrickxia sporothermodurans]MBL5782768.1 hypothetical protein [Heyndrickxia sporothermodurans]